MYFRFFLHIFAQIKTIDMKFKNLKDSDIEYAKQIYSDKSLSWDERMGILMNFFGKSERTVRHWLVNLGIKEKIDIESPQFEDAKKRQFDKTKKTFLVTWAQNDTPVHKKFLRNMEAYAEFRDADIHVIAGRYKNPTSVFTDKKFDTWTPEVAKYLDANRHDIHKYVSILSDVKIQPTATNPMSGLEGMSGINSCIFGSPKVQLEVIGALEGYKPKLMLTTGAVTLKNYTDSKAGKKGEFHHILGFTIVEIKDDEKFFVRQITATADGDFTDLFYTVKDGVISRVNEIEAIVLGDVHLGQTDEVVMNASIDLMDKLKPKHTVVHDLFDGYSISHHDMKDPIKMYRKSVEGKDSLKKEIDQMLEWIEKMRKYNLVVVRSNHDDFVDRWIINADWKRNVQNSVEYMEYAKALLEDKAPNGIIPYIINQRFKDVVTLGRVDTFKVKKWELAVHGDYGLNGSRGSVTQFRKLNTKIVSAHSHTPGRKDGALIVGTLTKKRLGYNLGASSWFCSDVIIHKDGKAQHILFMDGEYTTLAPNVTVFDLLPLAD